MCVPRYGGQDLGSAVEHAGPGGSDPLEAGEAGIAQEDYPVEAPETMPVLPQGTVKGLAEIVLRVKDLNVMESFYRDIIGLTVLRRFGDDMTFFRLPDGSSERPQSLALFSEEWPANVPDAPWTAPESSASTMHHFTLSVSLPDLFEAKELLTSAHVPTHDRIFAWAGWRSLMIADPERNVVELVALDSSIHVPIPG